jgi:hypothetical protein
MDLEGRMMLDTWDLLSAAEQHDLSRLFEAGENGLTVSSDKAVTQLHFRTAIMFSGRGLARKGQGTLTYYVTEEGRALYAKHHPAQQRLMARVRVAVEDLDALRKVCNRYRQALQEIDLESPEAEPVSTDYDDSSDFIIDHARWTFAQIARRALEPETTNDH